jgi:hypothetical protein
MMCVYCAVFCHGVSKHPYGQALKAWQIKWHPDKNPDQVEASPGPWVPWVGGLIQPCWFARCYR